MGSRERQRHQTRAALLDAGRAAFVRDGYHRASLDRIAREAGFTKGAVYAHFATKSDLLLAINARRVAARAEAIAGAAAGVDDLEELRRRLVADWQRAIADERGWSLLLLEFWLHAARDEDLRASLLAQTVVVRDAIAAALAGVAGRAGEDLPMPATALATTVMALSNGLNLEAFLDDDAVEGLYDAATAALAAARPQESR